MADQTRDFYHRVSVKVMDSPIVRHNQQHAFLGVKGNRGRQIDDVRRMFVNFQFTGRRMTGFDNRPT
ncbi:Uncharacterised protein [Enterobacter cloacae]|nr:Uncharacterised protein [Enterobacter cloacae]